MVMLDVLSNALITIRNAEFRGYSKVVVWPSSKLVGNVLRIMQKYGYVGEVEFIDDGRGGKYVVNLLGRINSIGPVKPRFFIDSRDIPAWEEKYLPARQIGLLFLSTSHGVLSHVDAKEQGLGGVLLAYVY
ncbi:30S ribosomal protein S8 [Thermocladium modestius]|uniref:Small ribosomal subunit protein uS8 n=1 Tax=Thermocladium modestius TaxID=62609 RepID=A0A830GRQ8_9CREN|nr:30S ribosomal protein S8 [Thermocladium modestius]GGP19178.1 30S ribosomal protein S8 [Thermocladium modestius]